MDRPWLSVLIPTYNGKDYLRFTLDSILRQGDRQIECIAIDDGSTDETLEILNDYVDKLPLKVIQGLRKGNWVATTNHILSIATADYVCFLHQDDIWLDDRLRIMKSLIDKHPQVNLFLHASQFIDRDGKCLGLWKSPLPKYPLVTTPHMLVKRLLIQNFIAIPAPIFRREAALQVGGLDEKLWYTADWDFWLKLAALGSTMYYPHPLSAFRIHADSQTIVRSSYLHDFQQQHAIVLNRHLKLWQASQNSHHNIKRIAIFSIRMNTALAGIIHGRKVNLLKLLVSFLVLGMAGWYRYWQYSRIWERVTARLKVRLINNIS
ncbi:glycosyltransferase [Pseudanabaena sp. 'Roaring Creek']|uniref:glycosyltransferase n=1 Tax=Pseudanabaena sp. 'Roaring Creek' TaxID=1681830 RepID=UPI0006D7E0DE|nr:glycosyltransferase [Pseudanabaena sp. 'Roaring Creek']